MSIYKHNYRAYTGRLTPKGSRILVLARYGFAEIWSSKITIALFVLCLLPAVLSLVGIYLANNPLARMLVGANGPQTVAIDARFFLIVLQAQSWLALVLAAWIAPRLITFDLADNALPILLSHPISRFGYVAGKFVALFGCLSAVTWVPCLLLFAYQSYSSPTPWAAQNMMIAGGLFAGAVLWVLFLSILGLALSSWVKWRMLATAVIFAAIFLPAGIGGVITGVLRTRWGFLLNVPFMVTEVWQRMLGAPANALGQQMALPSSAIVSMLGLVVLISIAMLNARIRAREVVRG